MRSAVIVLLIVPGCDAVFRLDPIAHVDAGSSDAVDMGIGVPSWQCSFDGNPVSLLGFGTNDFDPSQRSDKLELYFARSEGDYDIWAARRDATDTSYAAPSEVVALSSALSDFEPALQPDGLRVFFLSTRDAIGSRVLYQAVRDTSDASFTTSPIRVDTAGVTFEGIDLSADGRTLYASSSSGDLFAMSQTAAGGFQGMATLGTGVHFPSVAGDELTIYYHRDTTIYRRKRMTRQDLFADEEPIIEGLDPDISLDGRTLVYKSATGFATMECL